MSNAVRIWTIVYSDFEVFVELFAIIADGFNGFTGGSSKYTIFTPGHLASFVE